MHVPRGREVPLPGSGVSYHGRAGAGNVSGHYLDPRVFERVLEHENDIIHTLKADEPAPLVSGRGELARLCVHC